MGVGPHAGHLLKVFGAHVRQGFGHVPYQVGSSLTQKNGWRDVDVRLILPDNEFITYFGDPQKAGWDAPKLGMWNLAWTTLGNYLTRLPIDFQIQSRFEANSGEHNGPRSALIFTKSDLLLREER